MKTAVEWLVEQILQKVQNYEDGDIETKEDPFVVEYVNKYNFNVDLTKFVEQEKKMEKQQIIEFADQYGTYLLQGGTMSAVIYNETFKSE